MLHGFARLDGFFLNVKEGVDEMIKLLANEPSVGLFFVEQHAQTSMPYLLGLKVFLIPTPKCSKRSCHDVARQNDYHNIIASFSLHGEDVWQLNLFVFIVHLLHYIFSPRFGVWCSYLSCTEFIIL
ncbi:unnamed protein product [Musa acuminata subsp. burmannicoides]